MKINENVKIRLFLKRPCLYFAFLFILTLYAGNTLANNETLNRAPIVTVEGDKLAQSGEKVSISAICVDSDGLILRTRWTQTGGPKIKLVDIHSLNTGFTAPQVTKVSTISLRLDVTDNRGARAFDFIEISVHPKSDQTKEEAGEETGAETRAEKGEANKQISNNATLKNESDGTDSIISLSDYFNAGVQYYLQRNESTNDTEKTTQFDSTASLNVSLHIRPIDSINISLVTNPVYSSRHSSNENVFTPLSYGIQAYFNSRSMYAYTGFDYVRRERDTDGVITGSENSTSAVFGYRFKTAILPPASRPLFGNSIEFSSTMTNTSIYDFSYIDANKYVNALTFIKPTSFYGTWLIRYGYLINQARHDFGSDYTYRGHQLDLLYHKQLYKRFALSIKADGAYLAYINVDSYTKLSTGEEIHRYQRRMQFQTKIVYAVLKKLDVFGEFEYTRVWSNLATGFIYKGGAPVGIQDSSIGSSRAIGGRLGILFVF